MRGPFDDLDNYGMPFFFCVVFFVFVFLFVFFFCFLFVNFFFVDQFSVFVVKFFDLRSKVFCKCFRCCCRFFFFLFFFFSFFPFFLFFLFFLFLFLLFLFLFPFSSPFLSLSSSL